MSLAKRVADRYLQAAKALNLAEWGLEGLTRHEPVTLYHGTTRLFRTFDIQKSRTELVDAYYGAGIFLTPSKRIAEDYAEANRNIGFPPSIIDALKRKNPAAGAFLEVLFTHGADGWDIFWRKHGFYRDDPPPGEGALDMEGFQQFLGGVDPNTIDDIAGYILGSKTKPLGSDDGGTLNIFNRSTGLPDYVYGNLDEVGLDSKTYRPKVYTVSVRVGNPLVTASQSAARSAKQKGYDSVVYYGPSLVKGVPEVAVFNPAHVKVKKIEVV